MIFFGYMIATWAHLAWDGRQSSERYLLKWYRVSGGCEFDLSNDKVPCKAYTMCFLGRVLGCWDILKEKLSIYHYIPIHHWRNIPKLSQTTVFLSESMREVHSTTCLSARLRLIKDVTSSRGQNHLLALHRCCSWLPGAWGWKECHPQRDQVCIFCGIGAQNVEPVSLKLQAFGNKAKHWTKFLNNWLEVSHFFSGRLVPSVSLNAEDRPGIPWHVMEVRIQDSGWCYTPSFKFKVTFKTARFYWKDFFPNPGVWYLYPCC